MRPVGEQALGDERDGVIQQRPDQAAFVILALVPRRRTSRAAQVAHPAEMRMRPTPPAIERSREMTHDGCRGRIPAVVARALHQGPRPERLVDGLVGTSTPGPR